MRRTTAPTEPATSAAARYVAAIGVLADLGRLDQQTLAEQKEREKAGEHLDSEIAQNISTTLSVAEALLANPAASVERKPKGEFAFRALLEKRAAIQKAIEIGRDRAEMLRLEAAAERLVTHRDELKEAARQMCHALIALERAMQLRDRVVKTIGLPAGTLGVEGWPLAGRMGNPGSQAYRLIDAQCKEGFFSAKEFAEEYEQARQALR